MSSAPAALPGRLALVASLGLCIALSGCSKPASEAATPAEAPSEAAPAAAASAKSAAAPAGENAQPAAAAPAGKVSVEFYVMSQCPFGVQVENAFKPVLAKMGDHVDFQLHFIANEDPNQAVGFSAMHGETEVLGNIWQLCAIDQYGDDYKYMDFIECMNRDMRSIPNNAEACATSGGLDAAALKACATGQKGKDLLSASIKKTQARRATGSPTIYIADQRYSGGRTENDFIRAICNAFDKGGRPTTCSEIPEPKKVNAIVVTDSRCKDCNTDRIIGQIKGLFPGLVASTYDYTTPEGKAKYTELAAKGELLLPAIFFDDSVKEGAGFSRVQRYLVPHGAMKLLRLGAKWDPTSEICDNKLDDTGNGKVDCDDDTCAQQLVCRTEKKATLDVFVMSQCPFGVKALDSMAEVLDNFGDAMDFNIHFIADVDPNAPSGFSALHGEPEVRENIRELCAIKHYAKNHKYMDYILCRNKNIRSEDWKECTGGKTGIDASVIQTCSEGAEGKTLHGEDIKMAKALGIGASPTWLANNKYKFSGIDAETIKRNFCQYNPGTKNCDKKLTADPGAPAGGCGQ